MKSMFLPAGKKTKVHLCESTEGFNCKKVACGQLDVSAWAKDVKDVTCARCIRAASRVSPD